LIINGDSLEELKKIEDNSLEGCITDPPYNYEFLNHNWNQKEVERRIEKAGKSKNVLVKNIPYGSGLSGGVRNKNWYKKNKLNIEAYQDWIYEWGKEIYRILKPGSYVLVFNSTRTIAHVQIALEKAGFYSRDILVWQRHSGIPKGLNAASKLKQENNPNYKDWEGWHSCLRSEWESIVMVQKPLENNYLNTLKKYEIGLLKAETDTHFKSNIISGIKREKLDEFNNHPTVKPLELMEYLVELIMPEGTTVIDPFAGSGTTLLAAKNKNVNYIGIEINADYVDIAKRRLESQVQQLEIMDI